MSFHLTETELLVELKNRSTLIPLGSMWYHRKKPEVSYTVVDLVIDESTDEVAVVYEQTTGIRFVRLAKIFVEVVTYTGTLQGPRFVRK